MVEELKPSSAVTFFHLGAAVLLSAAVIMLDHKVKDATQVKGSNVILGIALVGAASFLAVSLFKPE